MRPFRIPSVALLMFILSNLAGCKSELYTGLNEREANEIVAALLSQSIPAVKSGSGEAVSVTVDQSRFPEAMALLDRKGLPSRKYDSMGDVFKKEGLVSSPTEERARMIYALSQELSRTVAEIDGVLSARIHVVLPEADMLGRDVKPSSASVFVRYTPSSTVETFAPQIKLLVANSIEGLLYDNITVVMVPAAAAEIDEERVEFAYALGLWIHPGSLTRFWVIVAGLIMIILGSIAGLVWTVKRQKASPEASDDADFEEVPATGLIE